MSAPTRLLEVPYSQKKTKLLEENLKEFYQLPSAPEIAKKVLVLQDTAGMPKPERVESEISFTFPSKRIIILHEFLEAPEGHTLSVSIKDFQTAGENRGYSERILNGRGSYLQAERWMVEEFEKELKGALV